MGRSRGGLSSKIHALVDRLIRLVLTPGHASDAPVAADLLSHLRQGATMFADRAYETDAIRAQGEASSAWANIPPRISRKGSFACSLWVYRQRNRLERSCNRIKHFRGLATRYDMTDANDFAGLTLAAIRNCLKSHESTSWQDDRYTCPEGCFTRGA